MNSDQHNFYRRREQAERGMAARAREPGVARIHLELAER